MKIRTISLMLVVILTLAKMASAAMVQLPCVANAREGGAWNTDLYMQGFTDAAMKSFFRFDVSAVPANAVVTSATVYTYMDWGGGWFDSAWQYGAREVIAAWGEATPFTTYPSIGTSDLGANATVTAANQWIINGITPALVQAWVDGTTPNYGVSISKATVGGEYIHVANRTDPTYAPYLLVNYTVPEPGALLAMMAGLAGLSGMRSRRRG